MASSRPPLGTINPPNISWKELSPYIRGKISAKSEDGKKPAQIARDLKIPDQTVRDTIAMDEICNEGKSKTRPGQLDKYSERFKRVFVLFVRKEPKASMGKIRKHLQSKTSNGSITRILQAKNMWHWRCEKRPFLTEEVAAKRLAWCLARKDWDIQDFMKYIFSDECSAERGAGGAQERAWCQPGQKWAKEFVTTYKRGKDIAAQTMAEIPFPFLYVVTNSFAHFCPG